MPFMTRLLLALASMLVAWAEPSMAQSGSAQPATNPPRHDEPVKPPSPAPRTQVQKSATDHKTGQPAEHRTPVVAPRKPSHPQKPEAASGKGTATQSAPAGPAPAAQTPAAPGDAKPPADTKTAEPEKPDGPKLPRFAALRSDDVNMRAGPGTRYRIEWVYKRRDLPVEIEREFDVWRWVKDPDGIQGWVHQATLMGRRNFIIRNSDATLRSEPSDASAAVAVLKVGVIGRIRSCEASSAWCHVQAGSYRGYVRRDQVWGVLPGEAVTP